jgi:hypothetical protein
MVAVIHAEVFIGGAGQHDIFGAAGDGLPQQGVLSALPACLLVDISPNLLIVL